MHDKSRFFYNQDSIIQQSEFASTMLGWSDRLKSSRDSLSKRASVYLRISLK